MNTKLSYIISNAGKNITLTVDGKVYPVDSSHPNHGPIVAALKTVKAVGVIAVAKTVKRLVNVASNIRRVTGGKIEVLHGQVFYGGAPLHNYAVDCLLDLMKQGFDIRPLQNFLTRLMKNPSAHSREHLYKFAEQNGLPITDEGKVVAFKIVNANYKDKYSNKVNNKVGESPNMPRGLVGDDTSNVCGSQGLYVGGYRYTSGFGSFHNGADADRVMIIEIDPADFVCIPDGESGKARVCRYTVVSELTDIERNEYVGGRDILSEGKVFNRTQKRDAKTGLFVSGWEETDGPVAQQLRDTKTGRFGPKSYVSQQDHEFTCDSCGDPDCGGECEECDLCGETGCDGSCED